MDSPEASSSLPPPPWVILDRVALVEHDSVEDPGELSVELARPAHVSTVTVPMSLHPKPNYDDTDKHPYVLAADPDAGLLLHVSHWPFVGLDLDKDPPGALLVAGGFLPADDAAGRVDPVAATVKRAPDRALFGFPGVSNLRSVGFVSRPGSGGADYVVAELRIDRADDDHATLLSFRAGADSWVETELSIPSMYAGRRFWSSHDVVAVDGKLWWVDLVWGLLGCDPFQDKPALRHVKLPPPARGHSKVEWSPRVESNRMVRVCQGKLLYVVMYRELEEPVEETFVVVRSLEFDESGESWWAWMSANSLGVMWGSNSYKAAGMPDKEIPVLALVHPQNSDVVYFFLKDYLFGFNLDSSVVTEFVYRPDLVEVVAGTKPPPPISWRYVVAWELPPSLANALDNLMDEDGATPVEESGDLDATPDPNDTPSTDLNETLTPDPDDTPIPDLND